MTTPKAKKATAPKPMTNADADRAIAKAVADDTPAKFDPVEAAKSHPDYIEPEDVAYDEFGRSFADGVAH